MIRKILFVFILLFGYIAAASAVTCPSASSSATITSSCSTGITWTGGNLTIGTSDTSISITNTNPDDVFAIRVNSNSLGFLTNKANNTIGNVSTGNAIQNDSGSSIRRIYNYGSLIASNAVWNDGIITALYNYNSISSANSGIWNNAGSINILSNSGSITAGVGANGVYNNALISTLNNSGSMTIANTGSGIANGGSGIITTLNNSGSITVSSSGWGISNGGLISTLNNSGSINLLSTGYAISNANAITTLNNSGSIDVADGIGIWNNSGTITTLNNLGTINTSGGDIINQSTIITLNNYANLIGTNVGVNNTNILGTFNNISSINLTSTISGVGVANSGTFTTLNNYGSIIVAGTDASAISNSGTISAVNNYGTLTTDDGANYNIYNNATITTLTNSGSINTGDGGVGIYNDGSGTVSTLTNIGSITASAGGNGIYNAGGTITTLNNTQGGNSSSEATTALKYTGDSPTNYNIGIVSETHYGKLLMDTGATITNVGIYGNPLLTSRTYAGVLTNDVTVTNMQNRYDNMTVALVNNADTSAFDLTFTGVSLMGTQLSLSNNAAALIPIYTLQNSILVNSFSYDCNQFDSNNFCVSAGGRNTKASSSQGLSDNSALLIAAYRPLPTYRVGFYIDQNSSIQNSGSVVNLDNNIPVIGLFAAWNQRLNDTGAEIKLSAAYGQKNATINRQIVGLSEFGSGSSSLNSQGAQLTAKYSFGLTKDFIISPYVGMRHAQNNMSGYTENNSTSLTAPLTYSALNTNTNTALAGIGASYRITPQFLIFASAALENTLNATSSQYSATSSGISGLTPIDFNPNPTKTRRTASLGAYYNLGKNQQIGIVGIHRQEALRRINTNTVMVTYVVGM